MAEYTNSATELDRFKTDINLSEYAASRGYELDKSESYGNNAVMRHVQTDDKIMINIDSDSHWRYYSFRDMSDNGSIVDFVKNRDASNLGEVRRELRPWIGERSAPQPINEYKKNMTPVEKSREGVIASFSKSKAVQSSEYLQSRGLRPETISNPRFKNMVREDAKGNALFPHYDRQGLTGYELKNNNFTAFAKGGSRSVWHSQARASDTRLVLVESAIDALSYQQMNGDANTRYISTAGQLTDNQKNIIKSAIEKMPENSTVVLGFDNDTAGHKYSKEIQALAPDANLKREIPQMGKDWNDQLKRLERDYIRQMGFSKGLGIAR